MPEHSIERVLENFFPKSTRSDWKKIAMQETSGKDPLEMLSWRGRDQLLFLPYYDVQDVAGPAFSKGFRSPTSGNTLSGLHGWVSLLPVYAPDAERANSIAREHLSSGADGILFDRQIFPHADLNVLLQNIELASSFLAFRLTSNDLFPDLLSNFVRKESDPASMRGALFWESIPKKNNLDFFLSRCKNFKPLGLVIPVASPAAEISHALLEGVKIIDGFGRRSDPRQVVSAIAFSFSADASLLETVAKFKAMRGLWRRVAIAYGYHDYKLRDLHLHAESALAGDGVYAPRENMLKGTFSAMAAVLGGCDSLTIMTEQQPAMMMRWSKNVSSILRDESFFRSVPDPVSGSYTVDTMVDEIARKAWSGFQEKWRTYDDEKTT